MRTHRNSNPEIPEQRNRPVKPRMALHRTTWNGYIARVYFFFRGTKILKMVKYHSYQNAQRQMESDCVLDSETERFNVSEFAFLDVLDVERMYHESVVSDKGSN